MRKYHILVIMRNKPGGVARISGLFTRRGYNIETITAGTGIDENHSRLTITVKASEVDLDQIVKQVYKVIDVVKVRIADPDQSIKRQLLLLKANCDIGRRSEIIELANIFKANILHTTSKTIVLELVGKEDKINDFIELIEPYGILEISRTGTNAMSKGDKF